MVTFIMIVNAVAILILCNGVISEPKNSTSDSGEKRGSVTYINGQETGLKAGVAAGAVAGLEAGYQAAQKALIEYRQKKSRALRSRDIIKKAHHILSPSKKSEIKNVDKKSIKKAKKHKPHTKRTHAKASTNVTNTNNLTNISETGKNHITPDEPAEEWDESGLKAHNMLRHIHGVEALSLDKERSREAEAYARELANTGVLKHAGVKERKGDGENIGYKCAPNDKKMFTAAEFTLDWYQEVCNPGYDFSSHSLKRSIDDVDNTGHFSQVIWRDTHNLGMGFAKGMIGDLVCTFGVARYGKAGNVLNKYDQNILKGSFSLEKCKQLESMIRDMKDEDGATKREANEDNRPIREENEENQPISDVEDNKNADTTENEKDGLNKQESVEKSQEITSPGSNTTSTSAANETSAAANGNKTESVTADTSSVTEGGELNSKSQTASSEHNAADIDKSNRDGEDKKEGAEEDKEEDGEEEKDPIILRAEAAGRAAGEEAGAEFAAQYGGAMDAQDKIMRAAEIGAVAGAEAGKEAGDGAAKKAKKKVKKKVLKRFHISQMKGTKKDVVDEAEDEEPNNEEQNFESQNSEPQDFEAQYSEPQHFESQNSEPDNFGSQSFENLQQQNVESQILNSQNFQPQNSEAPYSEVHRGNVDPDSASFHQPLLENPASVQAPSLLDAAGIPPDTMEGGSLNKNGVFIDNQNNVMLNPLPNSLAGRLGNAESRDNTEPETVSEDNLPVTIRTSHEGNKRAPTLGTNMDSIPDDILGKSITIRTDSNGNGDLAAGYDKSDLSAMDQQEKSELSPSNPLSSMGYTESGETHRASNDPLTPETRTTNNSAAVSGSDENNNYDNSTGIDGSKNNNYTKAFSENDDTVNATSSVDDHINKTFYDSTPSNLTDSTNQQATRESVDNATNDAAKDNSTQNEAGKREGGGEEKEPPTDEEIMKGEQEYKKEEADPMVEAAMKGARDGAEAGKKAGIEAAEAAFEELRESENKTSTEPKEKEEKKAKTRTVAILKRRSFQGKKGSVEKGDYTANKTNTNTLSNVTRWNSSESVINGSVGNMTSAGNVTNGEFVGNVTLKRSSEEGGGAGADSTANDTWNLLKNPREIEVLTVKVAGGTAGAIAGALAGAKAAVEGEGGEEGDVARTIDVAMGIGEEVAKKNEEEKEGGDGKKAEKKTVESFAGLGKKLKKLKAALNHRFHKPSAEESYADVGSDSEESGRKDVGKKTVSPKKESTKIVQEDSVNKTTSLLQSYSGIGTEVVKNDEGKSDGGKVVENTSSKETATKSSVVRVEDKKENENSPVKTNTLISKRSVNIT